MWGNKPKTLKHLTLTLNLTLPEAMGVHQNDLTAQMENLVADKAVSYYFVFSKLLIIFYKHGTP